MSENPDADKSIDHSELLALTSDIVAAYAGNNSLPTTDLPQLIESVFVTLSQAGAAAAAEPEQKPAVSPKKSLGNAHLICLECGQKQKTLKRHLTAAHGLTPAEYRAKWSLGHDYPMVAPDYAAKRRALAKEIGLGRKGTAKGAAKGTSSAPRRKAKS